MKYTLFRKVLNPEIWTNWIRRIRNKKKKIPFSKITSESRLFPPLYPLVRIYIAALHAGRARSSSSLSSSSTLRFQISRWRNHDLDWLISQHRSQLDSQSRGTAAVHLFCGTMCHPIFFPHDRFSPVNLTARLPLSRRLSPVLSIQHHPYIKITYVDFFFLPFFFLFLPYTGLFIFSVSFLPHSRVKLFARIKLIFRKNFIVEWILEYYSRIKLSNKGTMDKESRRNFNSLSNCSLNYELIPELIPE